MGPCAAVDTAVASAAASPMSYTAVGSASIPMDHSLLVCSSRRGAENATSGSVTLSLSVSDDLAQLKAA